jgi:hypothetical protein
LQGSFKAFLSGSTFSAISRFNTSGPPWVRPDGVAIVESATELAGGPLLAPINVTRDGREIGNYAVFTGASLPTQIATNNCGDYLLTTPDPVVAGTAYSTTQFFNYLPGDCSTLSNLGRLYCLEE